MQSTTGCGVSRSLESFLNTTDFHRTPQNYRLLSQNLRSKFLSPLRQFNSFKSFLSLKISTTFPHLGYSASFTVFLFFPTTSSLFSVMPPPTPLFHHLPPPLPPPPPPPPPPTLHPLTFRVTSHLTNPVKHRRLFLATLTIMK